MIAGDDGVLMTSFNNHDRSGPPLLQLRRGKAGSAPNETIDPGAGDGFRLEAESFARLVAGEADAWTGASPAELIDIMAAIAALRRSAGMQGAWVEIPAAS